MFRKIKDKITTIEVILDSLIVVLHTKRVVTRSEIQAQILETAMKGHHHERD